MNDATILALSTVMIANKPPINPITVAKPSSTVLSIGLAHGSRKVQKGVSFRWLLRRKNSEVDMGYYGGKSRQASVIIRHMEELKGTRTQFVDLFCGGLALTAKAAKLFSHVSANDLNAKLIDSYKWLMANTDHVMTREECLVARKNPSHPLHGIYSMSGSFAGKYSTTDGRALRNYYAQKPDRSYYTELNNSIRKKLGLLCNCEFTSVDYKDVTIPTNSVVYLDPPYEGTEHYYGVDSSDFDYAIFWEYCRRLSYYGNLIFVTSVIVPHDFKTLHCWGNTNRMSKAKTVIEKLVTL